MSLSKQNKTYPAVLDDIVQSLSTLKYVRQVILFGSRSRGDADSRSDIDLAVDCPSASNTEWTNILDIVNTSKTLLKIDCLRLDQASPELKHSIERAFILADETIQEEHLIFDTPPLETGSTVEDMVPAGVTLEEIEKAAIINTLEENEGNKTETARDLGISVKTLYNKLDKYEE